MGIMNEKDELKDLFRSVDWDTEEPLEGHELRFLQQLDRPRRRKQRWYGALAIAASVVVLLGIFLRMSEPAPPQYAMSRENREAQQFFASVIHKELTSIKSENSPAVRVMVDDAMRQLRDMQADYDKLADELARKGENEQLLFAMITNLKKRVAFLERVNRQIETVKKIKSESFSDENKM